MRIRLKDHEGNAVLMRSRINPSDQGYFITFAISLHRFVLLLTRFRTCLIVTLSKNLHLYRKQALWYDNPRNFTIYAGGSHCHEQRSDHQRKHYSWY